MTIDYTLPKPTAGSSRSTSPTESEIMTDISDTIADVGTRLDKVATALGLDDAVVWDSFNRADNALSLGTADSGQAWSAASGTWGIAINQGKLMATDSSVALIEASTPDLRVSVDVTLPSSSYSGLIFRALDGDDYLIAQLQAASIVLFKNVAGTFTQLATTSLTTRQTGKFNRLEVVAVEDVVTVLVNGVGKLTHVLSAGDQTAFGANTKIGFRGRPDNTYDNLLAINLDAPS